MPDPMKTAQNKNRSNTSSLGINELRLFHDVLLSVENDNKDKTIGYDWSKLKTAIGKQVIITNLKKEDTTPSEIEPDSILFSGYSPKGYWFLKRIRDAFAHNRIRHDSNGNLNINLYSRRTKDQGPRPILLGCLSFDNLKRMVEILKEQKQQPIKTNNKK